MSVSTNVVRFVYAQMYIFAIAILGSPDHFFKFYKSSVPLTEENKHFMAWWGIAILTMGLGLSAVAQCGEFACRKVLQYMLLMPMIQMWIAVKVMPGFAPESVIFTICHSGLNLCLSLYAVYSVPCAEKVQDKKCSSAVTWSIRYFYCMYLGFGLGITVFQDQFCELYQAKKTPDLQDKHIMWWWGCQMLGASFMLMAVAQCGYTACKKVLQYTMVSSMASAYIAITMMPKFADGWKGSAGHNMANVALAIIACYVVKPSEIKVD